MSASIKLLIFIFDFFFRLYFKAIFFLKKNVGITVNWNCGTESKLECFEF